MLHKHHIIPKYLGGDNSPKNLTPPISIELHAALHKDLYEHFGNQQDFVAWHMLLGQDVLGNRSGKFNPMFGKFGKTPWNKGKKLPDETKEKMSLAQKGKKKSKEFMDHLHALTTKNWIITFPDGHQEKIYSLNSFCNENQLSTGNMCSVNKGRRKSHKGYTCLCLG